MFLERFDDVVALLGGDLAFRFGEDEADEVGAGLRGFDGRFGIAEAADFDEGHDGDCRLPIGDCRLGIVNWGLGWHR